MARRYQVWSYHYPHGARTYSTNHKYKAEGKMLEILDKFNVRALALFRRIPEYTRGNGTLVGVLYTSIPLWRPNPEAVAWELGSPVIAIRLGLSPEFISRVTIKREEESIGHTVASQAADAASPQVLAGPTD